MYGAWKIRFDTDGFDDTVRVMDGSGDAYQYLIQRVEEILPDIARQVRDEIGRGRVVSGSKLPTMDRQARNTRMEEEHFGRIAKADLASVDYGDDERLALLVDALIRLANTMQASRKAIAGFEDQPGAPLIFEEPDGSNRIEIALSQDIGSVSEMAATVDHLLAPAIEELGRPS